MRCDRVSSDRINVDAYYHPDPKHLDSLSFRGGSFIKEDLSLFDAPFFSITAAEAAAMDPQQRLVLETSYRALESAGITMDQVSSSRTSVFTGSFGHDYEDILKRDLQDLLKLMATGISRNMLSNRVSWFFDLKGPSVTIDSACSSSLMAVDLACQSIWSGGSNMGIALGSNIILDPGQNLVLDNLGLLSPDSCSYIVDRRANGYARGEGVGALVIKPVDDAIRDGDHDPSCHSGIRFQSRWENSRRDSSKHGDAAGAYPGFLPQRWPGPGRHAVDRGARYRNSGVRPQRV